MIDQATKWAECCIVRGKSAEETVHGLTTTWIYRYGVPERIMPDMGANFTSSLMTKTCKLLGTKKITSCPYHPEGNAIIESFHRNLSRGLMQLGQMGTAVKFDEALGMVLYAYRTTLCISKMPVKLGTRWMRSNRKNG
eukprot:GHVO01004555.1.p1 GENE.GHVO01004555.1~~GHVO01004555.1.p1  ORF type:complete len:138 (+),score=11.23 GHVO01004555.1:351-764(+)